jgi:SH3-like domain-containing protein
VCLLLCFGVSGCGRFHAKPADKYVYVIAKQTYLRDRVAAVSNRTGNVSNGERLIVLERARRFVKVRSPRGEVGWIEEKLTADQALADKFEDLRQKHIQDSTVAQATARDEVYLHIAPGRETDRFFRLAEGDKLNLLARATVPKPVPPGSTPTPVKTVAMRKPAAVKSASGSGASEDAEKDKAKSEKVEEPPAAPPPVMEDWWLVRDKDGQTGWIYARMIDVDAPDVLARYSEGQRIVGAYVLAHVDDPDSGVLNNGQTVTSIPEYLTVLSPYQSGLPYDFNQVRVFIWNAKKHRYETSFRERNIAGYLPVQLGEKTDPYSKTPLGNTALPAFTYRVLAAEAPIPVPDPATGMVTPGKTITKTYRLEGQLCRRILPPGTQAPEEAHPNPESDKKKDKKHRR